MRRARVDKALVWRHEGDEARRAPDELVVEEPLEVRLDGHLVGTTMRTPGHDFELAVGLCHGDGLLAGATVRTVRYCGREPAAASGYNVVTVDTGGVAPMPDPRVGTTTSSCGLCGSTSIDELRERLRPLPPSRTPSVEALLAAPERVRRHQELFERTGAVHAAAALDERGEPVVVREDVGRHNAVDKVVGRLLLDGRLPAAGMGLFVSGRASFEMVQKAWAAGFGSVVAVSAPTALAVEAARAAGITLLGFARSGRATQYSPVALEPATDTVSS
jgi:FdhD protein